MYGDDLKPTHIYPFGMKIFTDIDIPPAIEGKDIFCLVVGNQPDGVGDYMHALDFARRIKTPLAIKGYRLLILVESTVKSDLNEDAATNRRAKIIRDSLKKEERLFDYYFLFEKDVKNYSMDLNEQFEQWKSDNNTSLETLRHNIAGAMLVSYSTDCLYKILPNDINLISCRQYGHLQNTISARPSLNAADMGTLNPDSAVFYGIKIKDPRNDHRSRIDKLNALRLNEPHFVSTLLLDSKLSPEEYFEYYHFMPAYLQTRSGASAFVLTQVLRFKDDGKICDFHLPKGVVDQEAITDLLAKVGITPDEIEFYPKDNVDASKNRIPKKIRIFYNRIELDSDFELLHQISDGAGCSGDNSVTDAFSLESIPWFETKDPGAPGGLGHFFRDELPPLCEKNGLYLLAEYFNILSRFRHLSLSPIEMRRGQNPEILSSYDPPIDGSDYDSNGIYNPAWWNSEKKHIHSERFIEYCQYVALLLKGEYGDIHQQWSKFLEILRNNNYYDQLENIIKASILTSMPPNEVLAECILKSREIIELTPDNLITMMDNNPKMYEYISFPQLLAKGNELLVCFTQALERFSPSEYPENKKRVALEKAIRDANKIIQTETRRQSPMTYHFTDKTPTADQSYENDPGKSQKNPVIKKKLD